MGVAGRDAFAVVFRLPRTAAKQGLETLLANPRMAGNYLLD